MATAVASKEHWNESALPSETDSSSKFSSFAAHLEKRCRDFTHGKIERRVQLVKSFAEKVFTDMDVQDYRVRASAP